VTLEAFGQSNGFMNIIRGPLGSGKTKCAVFKVLKALCDQRPDASGIRRSRVGVIRNTYPELVATTIAEFKESVHPLMGKFSNGHPPTYDLNFKLPDGTTVEAEIVFLALDREDDVRKLRGMQLTFVWLNELRFIPLAITREALSRCDRFPQPGFSTWVGGIGDTNSWWETSDYEVLAQMFASGVFERTEVSELDREKFADMAKLGQWNFFVQPPAVLKTTAQDPEGFRSLSGGYWRVNPTAENLTVLGEKYYQRQIVGSREDWIRVNLANEIGLSIDGKPVQPEYQEHVHKAAGPLKPNTSYPVMVGIDFGVVVSAAAFMQRQPNGQWWCLDELVCEDMGTPRFADEIKRKCVEIAAATGSVGANLDFTFRGDPAGRARNSEENTNFKILSANGVQALPASTNDPAVRRNALERVFTRMIGGQPGILISPKCKVLRMGLKGAWCYQRIKVSGAERYRDEPSKNFWSHVCEAAEYSIMDAGEHAVVNSFQARQFPKGPIVPTGALSFDI
jgi:hypothetical protein